VTIRFDFRNGDTGDSREFSQQLIFPISFYVHFCGEVLAGAIAVTLEVLQEFTPDCFSANLP